MERGRLAVNSSAELSTGSTTGWRADRPEPGLGASRLLGIPEQIAWLSKQAHMLGYADIDDLFTKNPRQFDVLAKYWREKHQLARLH